MGEDQSLGILMTKSGGDLPLAGPGSAFLIFFYYRYLKKFASDPLLLILMRRFRDNFNKWFVVTESLEAEGGGRLTPLTEGPVLRSLALFTAPLLATNLLQSLNGTINTFWVGRALGPAGLAATSNANLILFFLMGAVFGVSLAASIMVAQAVGARDMALARKVVGVGAAFFLVAATTVALAGAALSNQLLALTGTPAKVLDEGVVYLRILFLAQPAMFLFAFLAAVLRGAGDGKTPMVFMALAVGLDAVLNPILIHGLAGAPPLGIAGAAWATLASQAVTLLALALYLHRRKHPLRLSRLQHGSLKTDLAIVRTLVDKGLPIGAQMVVFSLSALVMIAQVNRYGESIVAAYGVALQFWTYLQMPGLAISGAVSAMAGQYIGARRWDGVHAAVRSGLLMQLVVGLTMAIAAYLSINTLLQFFIVDPEAVRIANRLNHITLWSFGVMGVVFVLFGAVRAAGAVYGPLAILLASMLLARPLIAHVLERKIGLDGLWYSFPASIALCLLMAAAYYRWGGWRKGALLIVDLEQARSEAVAGPSPPA